MGLPGSGKTTLAKKILKFIDAEWLNADIIRKKFNDWDFSNSGIIRQSKRMKSLADQSKKKIVIADFVCPISQSLNNFKPNFIIWMDTIKKGRFKDMNKIFRKPKKYNLRVTTKDVDLWHIPILDYVKKFKWNNKAETCQMLGRFQPFHDGHKHLFYEILKKKGQVLIMIKDVYKIGDNPFKFSEIKKKINFELRLFKGRFKVVKAPNISNICYGRTVGYKFNKINLDKSITKISATNIRKELRLKKKLKKL